MTVEECLRVEPDAWADHVPAFRASAHENARRARAKGPDDECEHWRLFAEVVARDTRDFLDAPERFYRHLLSEQREERDGSRP